MVLLVSLGCVGTLVPIPWGRPCSSFDENTQAVGWDDPTSAGFTAQELLDRVDGAAYSVDWPVRPREVQFGDILLRAAPTPGLSPSTFERPDADAECLLGDLVEMVVNITMEQEADGTPVAWPVVSNLGLEATTLAPGDSSFSGGGGIPEADLPEPLREAYAAAIPTEATARFLNLEFVGSLASWRLSVHYGYLLPGDDSPRWDILLGGCGTLDAP